MNVYHYLFFVFLKVEKSASANELQSPERKASGANNNSGGKCVPNQSVTPNGASGVIVVFDLDGMNLSTATARLHATGVCVIPVHSRYTEAMPPEASSARTS